MEHLYLDTDASDDPDTVVMDGKDLAAIIEKVSDGIPEYIAPETAMAFRVPTSPARPTRARWSR